MRTRTIALRAAGVGAVLVTAPTALVLIPAAPTNATAYARDSVSATVSPAEAGPGDRIEIVVRGCRDATGTAAAGAFAGAARLTAPGGGHGERDRSPADADAETAVDAGGRDRHGTGDAGAADGSRTLSGHTTLASRAGPGSHRVTVTCDGRAHRTAGTVRVRQDPAHPGAPTPVAPVSAGGGGTAALAAGQRRHEDTDGAGPGVPHTVVGLVLAGVAAVVVAFRGSRRRRTGSD